ncbi:UNVERIFIED_CONTAM: hypothetical protein Sangu_3223900 [Sesamum angustifolium]|uniref:DUF4283 domain-containing protein n=1 Tax=Sesamum angustifolium TaxID=2727405 RepID=A0AAW2JIE3_9LAMI
MEEVIEGGPWLFQANRLSFKDGRAWFYVNISIRKFRCGLDFVIYRLSFGPMKDLVRLLAGSDGRCIKIQSLGHARAGFRSCMCDA